MKNWDSLFVTQLLEAKDYRSFLGLFFKKDGRKSPKPLTYQEFSNRSGISSKSFLKDVIAGRKRLTHRSTPKVFIALKLDRSWREFLNSLIIIEEEDLRGPRFNRDRELEKLEKIKEKIRKTRKERIISDSKILELYLTKDFPEIFAALGSEEKGATIEDIIHRTNLPLKRIDFILRKMRKNKIVAYDEIENVFRASNQSFQAKELGSDEYFHKDFLRSIKKVKDRFTSQVNSAQSLFVTHTLSVSSDRLKEFAGKLDALLQDFTDDLESPEGDTVAEITLAFTNTLGSVDNSSKN